MREHYGIQGNEADGNYIGSQYEVASGGYWPYKMDEADLFLFDDLKRRGRTNKTETIKIPSSILEIADDHVIANCLIDIDAGIFEKRKFDIKPLKGVLDLVEGETLMIVIETKAGERKFNYIKDENVSKFFKPPKDYFSGLANTSFFKRKNEH